jgi:acetoin utilization protein AcuB
MRRSATAPAAPAGAARARRARLTVREQMTTAAFTIGSDLPLSVAHDVMRAHRIRHLPVLCDGTLVGVVSQRDLHLIESLGGVDPREVAVEEAMTPDPYTVSPGAALSDVVHQMAERRIGSAIVVERGKVVGMFTAVDALRVLGELLSSGPAMRRRDLGSDTLSPSVR